MGWLKYELRTREISGKFLSQFKVERDSSVQPTLASSLLCTCYTSSTLLPDSCPVNTEHTLQAHTGKSGTDSVVLLTLHFSDTSGLKKRREVSAAQFNPQMFQFTENGLEKQR